MWLVPGDPGYPGGQTMIAGNVFAGFCPGTRVGNFPWHGEQPAGIGPNLTVDFSELNRAYGLRTNYVPEGNNTVVGEIAYVHEASGAERKLPTFGAQDAAAGLPVPPPAPKVFIMPRGQLVKAGDAVKISWNAIGAKSCTASGDWTGTKPPSGGVSVNPTKSEIYTLTCSGQNGTSTESATVHIVDPPVLESFTAEPSTIAPGETATLRWASRNADYCDRSDATVGSTGANRSQSVKPPQTIAYSLICVGIAGTERSSVIVKVSGTKQRPTVYFEGLPKRISRTRVTPAP